MLLFTVQTRSLLDVFAPVRPLQAATASTIRRMGRSCYEYPSSDESGGNARPYSSLDTSASQRFSPLKTSEDRIECAEKSRAVSSAIAQQLTDVWTDCWELTCRAAQDREIQGLRRPRAIAAVLQNACTGVGSDARVLGHAFSSSTARTLKVVAPNEEHPV